MDFTQELDTVLTARYQPASINNAKKAAKWIYQQMGLSVRGNKFSLDVFDNEANSSAFVRNIWNAPGALSSKQMYLGYLRIMFDAMHVAIPEYIAHVYDAVTVELKAQAKSKKTEEHHYIDWKDMYQFYDQKKTKNPSMTNWMSFLLIAVLRESPRRIRELSLLMWKKDEDTDECNYIDFDNDTMVIGIHKTAKKFGVKRFPLSKELMSDLNEYKNKFPAPYVFLKNMKPYGEPATVKSISAKIVATFDNYTKAKGLPRVSMGIQKIRHDYATRQILESKSAEETIRKLDKASKQLGHGSITTTHTHYLKNISKEEELPQRRTTITQNVSKKEEDPQKSEEEVIQNIIAKNASGEELSLLETIILKNASSKEEEEDYPVETIKDNEPIHLPFTSMVPKLRTVVIKRSKKPRKPKKRLKVVLRKKK